MKPAGGCFATVASFFFDVVIGFLSSNISQDPVTVCAKPGIISCSANGHSATDSECQLLFLLNVRFRFLPCRTILSIECLTAQFTPPPTPARVCLHTSQ